MAVLTMLCRGARGSVPVSGEQFRRYGGGTTCYEIGLADNHRLLIDVGTGALSLNHEPLEPPQHFSILHTHLHWDHTLALPFLRALYSPENRFDFYGFPTLGIGIEDAIDQVMRPPWFPITFRSTPAEKHFHDLDHAPITIGDLQISSGRCQHPDGVTAYRIEREGVSVVVATDVEHGSAESEEELMKLASGADLLVYDAQYLPVEYQTSKIGWGHSTWVEAVRLAKQAEVGRLLITSHDHGRSDDAIDEILAQAREVFPNTEAAAEGLKIEVG
jgi:phosphoribosyl 1,2-cyclic phosphodiesterase